MDLHQNFICPLCLELAKQATESSCCTKIFCQRCIEDTHKKFGHCPCCRSPSISWHPSKIARKVISEIKQPCNFCQRMVENGAMEQHLTTCPKVPMQCKLCKESMLQEAVPEHTANKHQKEAKQYLIAYALSLKPKNSKIATSNKIEVQHNFFQPTLNRTGRMATIGNVSKYFCGGPMAGVCSCCDGHCGPDNGENCDACMELDVKRWNLSKGYLINTAGYACRVVNQLEAARAKKSIFSQPVITSCKAGLPCPSCAQMEFSLRLGRYNGLY